MLHKQFWTHVQECMTSEAVFSLMESWCVRARKDIRDHNPVTSYYRRVIRVKWAGQDYKRGCGCLEDYKLCKPVTQVANRILLLDQSSKSNHLES